MQDFYEFISSLKNEDKIIIVEGNKDKAALAKFNIDCITLSKYPLYKICEDIAEEGKDVIILTDFDKKGKQLYGRLKKNLERLGVKIDHKYREWLQRNTKLSHIEGLKRKHI